MDSLEYLLQLKQKIERAKEKKANYEGQLHNLFETLKKDYEIDTVEDAKIQIKKLERSISIRKARIEKGIQGLKESLGDGC